MLQVDGVFRIFSPLKTGISHGGRAGRKEMVRVVEGKVDRGLISQTAAKVTSSLFWNCSDKIEWAWSRGRIDGGTRLNN